MDTGDRQQPHGSAASRPLLLYGVTVAAVVGALVTRWLLDPLLGDHLPFVTFFVAVIVAAWAGGWRPALLATGLGFFLSFYFFVPPRFSFVVPSGPHFVGLAMYLMVCLAFAGFGEAMRVARRRDDEQKERLRTTLASIGDAVITTDTAGRVTSLNAVAETLTGWTTAEARGQPLDVVFRIVNETTRQPVENPAFRALKDGVIVGLANHTIVIAKDGTERPIDDSAAPIRCKAGEIVGCVLVFRDISERKGAEEELRRRTVQLDFALASTGVGLWLNPLPFGDLNWDARTSELYCVRPGERPTIELFWSRLHPDDREPTRLAVEVALRDRTLYDIDHRVVNPDTGELRWVRSAGQATYNEDGVATRFDGVSQDITARRRTGERLRENEERFRIAADAVNGIIYEFDFATGHVERTRGLYEVLGYRTDEVPATAAWWREQIHPDDREANEKQFMELVGNSVMSEYRVRHKDGRWLHVEDRAVLQRGDDGQPVKIVGCTVDVTAQKQADAELRRRETFASGVLSSVTDAFFVVGKDWRFTFVNDGTVRQFGKGRAEIVGVNVWEMFPDAVGNESHVQLHRAMADRVAVEYEVFYPPWQRWFLGKAYPTDDGGLAVYTRDITERKRVEQMLAERTELLNGVLEGTTDVIFVKDLNGRMLLANAAFAAAARSTPEQLVGKTDQELFPPDLASAVRQIDQAVIAGGSPIEFEETIPVAGEPRVFLTLKAPLHDGGGHIVGLLGISRDITDRKRTEERLRRNEERLRLVVESATDFAIFTMNTEGVINGWNAGAARLFGYAEAEVVGQHDRLLYTPEDAADKIPEREMRKAGADGRAVNERYHIKKDGSLFWGSGLVQPLRDGGGVVGFLKIMRDMTERREADKRLRDSELRYRNLFESMDEGFCVAEVEFDPAGRANDYRIVEMNPAFDRHTGLRNALGQSMRQAVPDLEEFWFETYGRVAATGEPIRFIHQAVPLEERWFEVYAFRLGGDGTNRVAILFNDISDRKLHERERDELVGQLREADRRKDIFLATLAHELRNPLAPIRNGLQVICMAGVTGAVEKARSMMDRQVTQLVRLVDDLLDVSRVTSGKLELRKGRLELSAVIDAAVETSRPVIEQAGHELIFAVPDEPIFVNGDHTRLAQVVSNLLNNSAKYTLRGGHVRLAVERDGEMVLVSVKDDGIGIPPAMLNKVFEMFTQVDRTLEKTTGGLGIGLSLVKGLVEMHGGTIEARSDGEGKGSEFVVRLPVVTPDPGVADPSNGQDEEVVTPGLRRILVVDDNMDAADSLAQILELLGNEVRTAYDGEAGVQAAGEFRPAVVLCDIGMPKVNGYEAARRIRAEKWGKNMVLVALTGWGHDDDRQKSADAGFNFHLVKPLETAALMRLLAGLQTKPSTDLNALVVTTAQHLSPGVTG